MNDDTMTIDLPTEEPEEKRVRSAPITPPNFEQLSTWIEGTSQLVVCAFSEKQRESLMAIQRAGAQGGTRSRTRTRTPKDFQANYEGARHISEEGWDGIVFTALRNAMIDATGTSQYQTAKASRCLFIIPDGIDRRDGVPLVRIHGKPERFDMPARLLTTGSFDIRTRPRWRKWALQVTVEYDADWYRPNDVLALLQRAGKTIGIGEGRYHSKNSHGLGWGCFKLAPGRPKV
jgi:hypothetical protein